MSDSKLPSIRDVHAGTLLLSEPFMKDANFARAVVLIVRHDEEGTLGFVLNQLTDITLDALLEEFPECNLPVAVGGPVAQDTLHFIHSIEKLHDSAEPICSGIDWGGDIEQLEEMLKEGEIIGSEIRFFIGYSGWSTGQLSDEITQGAWVICNTRHKDLLQLEPSTLWHELLSRMGGRYRILANAPIDPILN